MPRELSPHERHAMRKGVVDHPNGKGNCHHATVQGKGHSEEHEQSQSKGGACEHKARCGRGDRGGRTRRASEDGTGDNRDGSTASEDVSSGGTAGQGGTEQPMAAANCVTTTKRQRRHRPTLPKSRKCLCLWDAPCMKSQKNSKSSTAIRKASSVTPLETKKTENAYENDQSHRGSLLAMAVDQSSCHNQINLC
eukprot:6351487-Amphidinium_carterae.1